ncbi:MAG TPA: hypothetical protein VJR49_04340, partial [Chthoniobacterales bacterium]|nr:hypothetical protein [Chthoniobacterales bacterium]
VSRHSPCAGKSNCIENGFQSFAEIVAAYPSGKTWQLPALPPGADVRNDRRPHIMVLRAVPEANMINTSL